MAQYNYWEQLAGLHNGLEFPDVYGTMNAHPTLMPKGPITWLYNYESLLFVDKYAGELRNPATAPGVWIALRGFYFENYFAAVFMKRWIGNYEGGIIHTNLADSVALYGFDYAEQSGLVAPIVKRSSSTPNWAADLTSCQAKYDDLHCEAARQTPNYYIGQVGSTYEFSYAPVDLGLVKWCGTDMFCTGTATRTETMLWARRTNAAPILLDVNNAFASSITATVTIRVVYLDQGSGQWKLDVDGVTRATISRTGSNYWKEVSVNAPPGNLDIELVRVSGTEPIFHMVEVER